MKKTSFLACYWVRLYPALLILNDTTKLKQPDEKVLNNSVRHPRPVLLPL
jgi:hypothetical protein